MRICDLIKQITVMLEGLGKDFGYKRVDGDCTDTLVFDAEQVFGLIEPIESPFSPREELAKVRSLGKPDRPHALAEFKSKLIRQREAWALCRFVIENMIANPTKISRAGLHSIIYKFAANYGFAPDQIEIAKNIVDEYWQTRSRIQMLMSEFDSVPDCNLALARRLTGLPFPGANNDDFSIFLSPYAINIACSQQFAEQIRSGPIATGDMKIHGFARNSADDVPYSVIISQYSDGSKLEDKQGTIDHEDQHHKYRILKKYFDQPWQLSSALQTKLRSFRLLTRVYRATRLLLSRIRVVYRGSASPLKQVEQAYYDIVILRHYGLMAESKSDRDFFLRQYMEAKRYLALKRVKDEIFAMKINKWQQVHAEFCSYDGGTYDYLNSERNNIPSENDSDGDYSRMSDLVFKKEYGNIIFSGELSFDRLVDAGYSIQIAIALLTDVELENWPKTIDRILNQKKDCR